VSSSRSIPRRWSALGAAIASVLIGPELALGIELVDTFVSPPGVVWIDLWHYSAGDKLFVLDQTSETILVYDATSLAALGSISVSSYAGTPQQLAGHDGTGTLYVVSDTGGATSLGDIVIIDADSQTVSGVLGTSFYDAHTQVDEARARLYVFHGLFDFELSAFEVATNTPDGSILLNSDELMPDGIIDFDAINPATGELFFTNRHFHQFVVVDGETLAGELFEIAGSRGWESGTWNPVENKLYITTITWGGYFVYDRETGDAEITSCINDGTRLFFSAATNRVYSGAEVNGDTTVIAGPTDACQNVEVGDGRAVVGFVERTRHAYFAGSSGVSVLDETTLTEATSFAGCGYCEGGGLADHQVAVDQVHQRVFVRSWCETTKGGEGSCVQILDEGDLFLDGFESGATGAWSATVPPP
jgi:hypothetical protein